MTIGRAEIEQAAKAGGWNTEASDGWIIQAAKGDLLLVIEIDQTDPWNGNVKRAYTNIPGIGRCGISPDAALNCLKA
jgi:hypothetical protein